MEAFFALRTNSNPPTEQIQSSLTVDFHTHVTLSYFKTLTTSHRIHVYVN